MRHRIWVLVIAVLTFLVDWFLKHLVATHMVPGQSIAILPPLLWITYITNSGAAFSLLRHATVLFVIVGLIILAALAWYIPRAQVLTRTFGVGAGLLAGGTAGNLWDRLVRGRVIDYVHFRYWAIFNLADAAIVIGILLIVIDLWHRDREEHANQTPST